MPIVNVIGKSPHAMKRDDQVECEMTIGRNVFYNCGDSKITGTPLDLYIENLSDRIFAAEVALGCRLR